MSCTVGSKGDRPATSLVWAGVAGAVAIVFALSWPALIRSVDAKRYSAALIALVAMLLSGAYSVTAALGSRSRRTGQCRGYRDGHHGRPQQGAGRLRHRQGRTGSPGRRQTRGRDPGADRDHQGRAGQVAGRPICGRSRGVAQRRPSAIPSATAAPWSMARWRSPARSWTASSPGRASASAWGPRSLPWLEDAGEAEQRVQEQRTAARAAMDKASGELARIQPGKQANSDAVALSRYLVAVGLHMTPDRLNDLLVLLAVLMIEAGGGLALAVGMALQVPARELCGGVPKHRASDSRQLVSRLRQRRDGQCTPTVQPSRRRPRANTGRRRSLDMASGARTCATHMAGPVGVQLGLAGEILDRLRLSGGRTEGVRCLAGQLGRARSTVSDECHRLVEAGRLTMTRGRRGTVLALAAGRPN